METMPRNPEDHPIRIAPFAGRVTVRSGGRIIADTVAALSLHEADYPPVFYVPRADAHMERLTRTTHTTYCPYKGHAAYFSLENGENAVWTYEEPKPEVHEIKDYLAFYPDLVEIETAPA
jgi:uncharacterized protein (DUF427 family)